MRRTIGCVALALAVGWPLAAVGESPGAGEPVIAPGTQSASPVSDARNRAAANHDAEVLGKIHQANQMEIEAGRLAKKNGASSAIKRYGELLIRDHGMADRKIAQYAKRRGIELRPPAPGNETERAEMQKQMATMKKLETLTGAAFDREFATAMAGTHEMAIATRQSAGPMISDPDLRSLIGKMLPILEQHRKLAQDLGARAPRA